VVSVTADPETACYIDVGKPRTRPATSTLVQSKEKCGPCFSDGEIPADVEEVVVDNQQSKVHLTVDYEADTGITTPENPGCQADALATKIGSKSFGPDDLDELAFPGGKR